MKRILVLLSLMLVMVAGLTATSYVSATPSAGFTEVDGNIFDSWGICRTNAAGKDGFYQISEEAFRPVIVFESLGENAALAYSLGEEIARKYPDQIQRAEAVFSFVRDRVSYTPDIDQLWDGARYEEFAQNADELATAIIDQDGVGYGDCEDSTVLLAVMYKGAGYRSAIMVSRGHTAALVYLPDYKKATVIFELEGESGWVWAEATGKNNSLGWVPKELINAKLAALEISAESIAPEKPSAAPPNTINVQTGGSASVQPFSFIGVIGLLWFMSLFRGRRARKTR